MLFAFETNASMAVIAAGPAENDSLFTIAGALLDVSFINLRNTTPGANWGFQYFAGRCGHHRC